MGGTVLFSGGQISKLFDGEKVGKENVERAKNSDPSLSMLENFIGVSVDSKARKNAFIVLDESFFNIEPKVELDDPIKEMARILGHEVGSHVQRSHNAEGKRNPSGTQHDDWGQDKWSGKTEYGERGTPAFYFNVYINLMEKGQIK